MGEPCIGRINQSAYLIASTKPYIANASWQQPLFENLTFVSLYDFETEKFVDISDGFPCEGLNEDRILCAKYQGTYLVISIVSKKGKICTGIFNLITNFWTPSMNQDHQLSSKKAENGVMFNPIGNVDEIVLINGIDVYLMIQFQWQVQWQMEVEISDTNFLGQSIFYIIYDLKY